MVSTPADDGSHGLPDQWSDPIAAAQRYERPHPQPGEEAPPNAAGPRDSRALPPAVAGPAQSRTPLILGVVGIVCWFVCGIGAVASIIVGAIGHRKARELGQPVTVPMVAWIGGVVTIVLDVVVGVFLPPTYGG